MYESPTVTLFLIFSTAFLIVFALGFQSLCVNQGHHKMAFCNSIVIGICNLVILKEIPDNHSILDIAAYLSGGPFGIVASMWVHRRMLGRRREDNT